MVQSTKASNAPPAAVWLHSRLPGRISVIDDIFVCFLHIGEPSRLQARPWQLLPYDGQTWHNSVPLFCPRQQQPQRDSPGGGPWLGASGAAAGGPAEAAVRAWRGEASPGTHSTGGGSIEGYLRPELSTNVGEFLICVFDFVFRIVFDMP